MTPSRPGPAAKPVPDSRETVLTKEWIDQILREESPRKKKAWYDAIRRLGTSAVPGLLEMLDDPSPARRMTAINALTGMRVHAPRMIEASKSLLYTSEANDAVVALFALGADDALVSAIDLPEIRDLAIHLVGARGNQEPLIRLASNPGRELGTRLKAALAVDEAPRNLLQTAERLMHDASAPVDSRAQSVRLLVKNGVDVSPMLEREFDDGVRAAAVGALFQARRLSRPVAEAIAGETRPSQARRLARQALSRLP